MWKNTYYEYILSYCCSYMQVHKSIYLVKNKIAIEDEKLMYNNDWKSTRGTYEKFKKPFYMN